MIPPRFLLSADSPLCIQHGALKDVHPLGVFFLPAGKDVRIVDWIRFINYILLSIKDFVNDTSITSGIAPTKFKELVNTVEVVVFDSGTW